MFAGDGQLIAQWGGVLEAAADVPPTMIVAAHRPDDETLRLHEYSPAFDAARFAAHERFFVDDVRAWARGLGAALPAERTAVLGVSAGGEFALAMGHPAARTSSAPSSARPPAGLPPAGGACPRSRARTSVPARWSRSSLDKATRWAAALRGAGADVVLAERVGSHGDALWRDEFPLMVAWAFGR